MHHCGVAHANTATRAPLQQLRRRNVTRAIVASPAHKSLADTLLLRYHFIVVATLGGVIIWRTTQAPPTKKICYKRVFWALR